MNKGPEITSTASNSVGVGPQGSEMLSMLAAASPEQQKQILGERLYPLVQKHEVLQKPNSAYLKTITRVIPGSKYED